MTDWMKDLDSSPNAMHVAWMGELAFHSASETDKNGRTVRFSVIRSKEERGQAHPFAAHTLRRRGFAGTRFQMSISPFDECKGLFEYLGEVLLLGWSDAPRGATVTFALPPDAPVHPFMACVRPGKDTQASRWMACFVELNDEDAPVNQVQRAKVEAPKKVQHLSVVARLMTKNPVFWSWIADDQGTCADEATADAWLKRQLQIDSKAELDRMVEHPALLRFEILREEFVKWQLEHGYDPTR